ncbi:MAG TPA: phospholipase D-like domain-containing protein, partial [Terriglobales bacterium]|nr:phospholipase D-like domain-containing protein [Terriglobales bacterium]
NPIAVPIDSPAFLNELEPLVNSKITRNNQIEVIENGDHFYEAELDAMRQARHSINIEAYIFHTGRLTDEVLQVLTDRARAGVHVNLVLDAAGSFSTRKSYFKELKQAGGNVDWYHRLRLHNWFIANNRTHREITLIDGSTAFVGGAGYADWWRYGTKSEPLWRDTMFRIRGDAVRAIQGTFLENYLEASGRILDGGDYFPPATPDPGNSIALVITSTPSTGGSTRSRVLFQTLIAGARKSIYITTPYFLPDRSMMDELAHAAEQGISVNVIVPGTHDDHALTRSSGRSAYGKLLKAGARVYEYEPSMIHAKIAIFDGVWSVVGSTNLDNRSFGINDEISVAVLDPEIANRLTQDFEADTRQSRNVNLEEWENRPLSERLLEMVGWVFEREQ